MPKPVHVSGKDLSQQGQADATQGGIPPRLHGKPVPLSYAQEQIWLHAEASTEVPLYNEAVIVRRTGPLDIAALERALNEIVRRHEAWRTTFSVASGDPTQVIHPTLTIPLPVTDLRGVPEPDRKAEALRLHIDDTCQPFDIGRGPLLRARLVQLGDMEYQLCVSLHHMIFDGISMYQVFLPELAELYDAFSKGEAPPPTEFSIQYGDWASWQRQPLQEAALAPHLEYWRKQLTGNIPVLELPGDRPRPPVQTFRGAMHPVVLPKPLVDALKNLSQRERVTFFMTLLAAFYVILYRYTGQEEILVATPTAGRNDPQLDKLLGLFSNLLVLRSRLSGGLAFVDLLAQVRETTLEALSHAEVPYGYLVKELKPKRDPSRNTFFQALLSLVPSAPSAISGWSLTQMDVDIGASKWDLFMELEDLPEGIVGRTVYSTELFDAETIERFTGHWQTLLEGIAADPRRKVAELPLLTARERQQVLVDWNDTATGYPRDRSIHALFDEQAARTPDAPAVVCGEEVLSYAQLRERSNEVARRLKILGAGPDTPVAIAMERSTGLVEGLLGILKAGGAYVPLDLSYPAERLNLMLADSGAKIVVTEKRLLEKLPACEITAFCLDADIPEPAHVNGQVHSLEAGPDNLAYIIYTSGSTGRPKGTLIPHRGVVRLVKETNYAGFGANEVFLQLAPLSFDAATFEIWGPLLSGGKLVMMPPGKPSLEELGEAIRRYGITTLWLTTGLFHAMVDERLEDLRPLRQLLTGGDVLSPAHMRRVLEQVPGCRLIACYGPTEGTTFTSCYTATAESLKRGPVPIGRPISNTRVYILDGHMQPVPPGIPGELYIAGDGLARGYLNSPELNAEKFVPDPFSSEGGSRLYRSGDLARWLPDGMLEFLGRIDTQLKIRGFRVEPGEIESALVEHERVKEAVVVGRSDASGNKNLVAYVVPHDSGGGGNLEAELKERLAGKLPEYMRPASIVLLDRIPLTANGKVDRSALPSPEPDAHRRAATFVAPRDKLEARLVKIWEKVLGVQPVSVNADFFELGGHSLTAAKLLSRIEQEFGVRLSLASLFQAPTVEQIAAVLRGADTAHSFEVVPMQPAGSRPPFFCLGAGPYLRPLVQRLGADQPFFGLTLGPAELAELPLPYKFEDIAARLVKAMRKEQPEGPYYLGGWCQSGMMAYEMAQQLLAAGERVPILVMFDSYNPEYFETFAKEPFGMLGRKAKFHFENLRRMRASEMPAYFVERLRDTPLKIRRVKWRACYRLRLRGGRLSDFEQIQYVAANSYRPRPYPGRVVLFQPAIRPEGLWNLQKSWEGLVTSGLEVCEVPGDHASMFLEPNVDVLAGKMGGCLSEAQESRGASNRPQV